MLLLRRLRLPHMLCCASAMLAACTNQGTVAAFLTGSQTIALQQERNGSGYYVSVSPKTKLPLDGYISATIASIWDTPSARLIVVTGASADCPHRYALIMATTSDASLQPIGECGEAYSFAQEGDEFAIRQSDARNGKSWIFKDGVLRGPIVQRSPVRKAKARSASTAEGSTNPMAPPSVSLPVGDEVIPSPVGRPGRTETKTNNVSKF